MFQDRSFEDASSLEVPVTGFARRAEGVLIKPGAILSGPAGVTLADVGADIARSPEQLVGDPQGPAVLNQLRHVLPREVAEKQPEPIRLDAPNRVLTNECGDALFPFLVGQ